MTDFRQLSEKHPMAGQKAIFAMMAGKTPNGVADSAGAMRFSVSEVNEIQAHLLIDVRANMATAGGFRTLEDTRDGLVLNLDKITEDLKKRAALGQGGVAADSFYNALTGIGTSLDPGYYNAATIPISMSPNEATSYYSSGGIPAIVIDKKSQGIWMNGYQFIGQDWDEGDLKKLKDYGDKLNFEHACIESWRDGLIYGGSVLTPAFKKDTPATYEMSWEELLKAKVITQDCIDYFWSADRWNSVLIPDFNISAKDYLNPRLIMIPLAGHAVHRDRMALIRPKKLPYWGTLRQIGWGVSDFEGWIRSLLAYEIMIASLPMISQQLSLLYRHLPFDATAGMTGIRAAKKAAQDASTQLKQWNLLNPQTFNSIGELKTIERHFTDFDKLIAIARQDVGAKSGISDTILFHTQASGFSSNEEDTLLKEAATIKEGANQAVLQLQPLVKVLVASCFGPDSEQFKKADAVRISFESPTVLTNDQRVASLTALGGFVSSMQTAGMQLGDTMTVAQQFLPDLEVPDDMAERIKAFDDREQEFEDETRDLTLEQGKSALNADPQTPGEASDSEFREEDHPRDGDGKFTNGSGGIGRDETPKATHVASFGHQEIKTKKQTIKVPEAAQSAKLGDYYSEKAIDRFSMLHEKGKKLREKYPDKSETYIYTQEAYSSDPELDLDEMSSWSPAALAFFKAGLTDGPVPSFNVGWRYGKAPDTGASMNFQDGQIERGVSFMQLSGDKKLDGTYEMFNGNQLPEWYVGFELNSKGSDGESLMVGVKPLKTSSVADAIHGIFGRK